MKRDAPLGPKPPARDARSLRAQLSRAVGDALRAVRGPKTAAPSKQRLSDVLWNDRTLLSAAAVSDHRAEPEPAAEPKTEPRPDLPALAEPAVEVASDGEVAAWFAAALDEPTPVDLMSELLANADAARAFGDAVAVAAQQAERSRRPTPVASAPVPAAEAAPAGAFRGTAVVAAAIGPEPTVEPPTPPPAPAIELATHVEPPPVPPAAAAVELPPTVVERAPAVERAPVVEPPASAIAASLVPAPPAPPAPAAAAPPIDPPAPRVAPPAPVEAPRPAARARAKAPEPEDADAPVEEPIRTRSMARLLAGQGHKKRALAIYDALLRADGNDEGLRAEAEALRQAAP